MKFLISLVLLFSVSALGDPWPYDPVCRRFNASSDTVQIIGMNEGVVLCKFGIGSYVDKNSLPTSISRPETLAVRAYRQNDSEPIGRHCTEFGAQYRRAIGSNGQEYSVCYFFDHSVMEEQTFLMGPESTFNSEMNQALGLPWLFDL